MRIPAPSPARGSAPTAPRCVRFLSICRPCSMMAWDFLPLIWATNPTPQASCSLAGSYRPCAAGGLCTVILSLPRCLAAIIYVTNCRQPSNIQRATTDSKSLEPPSQSGAYTDHGKSIAALRNRARCRPLRRAAGTPASHTGQSCRRYSRRPCGRHRRLLPHGIEAALDAARQKMR